MSPCIAHRFPQVTPAPREMRPVSRQRFADAPGHYPQRLLNCPGRRTSERQTDGARPCAPGPRGGQRSKSLRGKRVDKPQPPPQSPRTKPPGPAALNQQEVAFSALRAEPQDPGAAEPASPGAACSACRRVSSPRRHAVTPGSACLRPHFTRITPLKALSPNTVTVWGAGGRDSGTGRGGDPVQPTQ